MLDAPQHPVLSAFSARKAAMARHRTGFGLEPRRHALNRLAAAVRRNGTVLVAALRADLGRP
jgi:hypothetical protein